MTRHFVAHAFHRRRHLDKSSSRYEVIRDVDGSKFYDPDPARSDPSISSRVESGSARINIPGGVFTMQFGLEIVGGRWSFGVPAERNATMPVEAPSTQSTTIVLMVGNRHRARSF
ncbi:hypothetical protein WR25_26843 [Diploscapter pachys]|uniref:Uncharacterized protein n=1 Tax=Diploscapter pachys TaxID=2018661 RepID=A0A2A2L029_9BILA|nr:hypothetical protein WR25_26843 [Diploscapter pachys]